MASTFIATPLVHQIRPLEDVRWDAFVARHPRSSVFHSSAWLRALQRTYGYEPIAITTSAADSRLRNAVVLCRVNSWLTGRRLVSVPFSDHCEMLVDDPNEMRAIVSALEQQLSREKIRYIELRSIRALENNNSDLPILSRYSLHQLDLTADLDTLFHRFHKSSTQRKIRRAERECLEYVEGRSERLLDTFYKLFLVTRRRHNVPPQPKKWFRNLIDCFGSAIKIQVALRDSQPIAAIITLRHNDTLLYKYGASNAKYHNLGGMHLLLWRSIQEAKRDSVRLFDLGRTDLENTTLIIFKNRWGATQLPLTYHGVTAQGSRAAAPKWQKQIAKRLVPLMPDRILIYASGLLYKHIG